MTERAPILDHLGELESLLREYQDVQANAPVEPHFVEYCSGVKLDKQVEGYEILGFERALTIAGFATDSVRVLLANCVEYEATVTSEIDEDDLAMIASLKVVPEDLRKSARIMNDRYYYAGKFHSTQQE